MPSQWSPDGGAARAKPRRPSSCAQASTSEAASTLKPIWIPSREALAAPKAQLESRELEVCTALVSSQRLNTKADS